MTEVNPTDPSQVSYPWRASLRTGFQAFLGALGVFVIAAPMFSDFVEQFWPGSPAIAWIGTAALFAGAIATLITRLMAIEGFNALLTKVGLGATPAT